MATITVSLLEGATGETSLWLSVGVAADNELREAVAWHGAPPIYTGNLKSSFTVDTKDVPALIDKIKLFADTADRQEEMLTEFFRGVKP